MPSLPNAESVLAQLVSAQILTKEQLQQLREDLDFSSPTFIDACLTQSRLNGWLTRWQTEQISAGRIDAIRFGEFLLTEFVHRGRSARIFRAVSTVDQREVALKLLTSQGQADPKALAGLELELAISSQLNSPTLVKCEGIEIFEGRHCLVRQWVTGQSIRQFTHEHGRFDRDQLMPMLITLTRGLAEFHAAGLRHGSISARHIILNQDGVPVWVDPGYASSLGAKSSPVNTSV
ncbi:MAG: serine/threonine protein kinase, partial [bacterium]